MVTFLHSLDEWEHLWSIKRSTAFFLILGNSLLICSSGLLHKCGHKPASRAYQVFAYQVSRLYIGEQSTTFWAVCLVSPLWSHVSSRRHLSGGPSTGRTSLSITFYRNNQGCKHNGTVGPTATMRPRSIMLVNFSSQPFFVYDVPGCFEAPGPADCAGEFHGRQVFKRSFRKYLGVKWVYKFVLQ